MAIEAALLLNPVCVFSTRGGGAGDQERAERGAAGAAQRPGGAHQVPNHLGRPPRSRGHVPSLLRFVGFLALSFF